MVRSKSNVKYYAKQIKHIIMRKDVVYLGMIWCNDIMSLNTSDEGYNNGKKCGQKGAICGPNINLLGELQNLYVKIPLLQALRDVPIYARTMRDICVKKPSRKIKDPLTVHVMGDLSALMSGKSPPVKYDDVGHPTVSVQIGKTIIP
jgi:hypothetical protein